MAEGRAHSVAMQFLQQRAAIDEQNDCHKYLLVPMDNNLAIKLLDRWRNNKWVYPAMAAVTHHFLK